MPVFANKKLTTAFKPEKVKRDTFKVAIILLLQYYKENFSYLQAPFSWMFLVGAIIVLLGFIGITVLDHYGARDPLWIGIKKVFSAIRNYRYVHYLNPCSAFQMFR